LKQSTSSGHQSNPGAFANGGGFAAQPEHMFATNNTSLPGGVPVPEKQVYPVTEIILVGWSRGAVTCHMMANKLFQDTLTSHIPVSIFAVDPVAGSWEF
jgi:hypothetical protein